MPPAAAKRRLVLVIALAAALYLIGNNLVDLWDRDEPRYAQTSKQMLESGDWVVPRLLDKVRTAKPALIYWCQAASMRLFGTNEFAARFPSALAVTLVLVTLGITIGRFVGWQRALWTTVVLSTSALVILAAKMCITDGVLLLFVTVAQVCLFALYRESKGKMSGQSPNDETRNPNQIRMTNDEELRRNHSSFGHWSLIGNSGFGIRVSTSVFVILWVSIALAILTKGPVILGVQFTTMIALAAFDVGRDWRKLGRWIDAADWWWDKRHLLAIPILLLICGPWLWMIQQREPAFLRTTILHDVLERSIKPLEGHKGPPGFYLATILGTFFPWCLLLPTIFTIAWKHRRLPMIRFALAAVIGPWVMVEIYSTKLPHYLLPAFPPLAFLTADAIVRCIRKQHDDLHRPIFIKTAAVFAAIVGLIGLLPWYILRIGLAGPGLITLIILSITAAAYGGAVLGLFAARRIGLAAAAMGLGMMAIISLVFLAYLPQAEYLRIPRRVGEILNRQGATHPGDVVMIDFQEDSLAWYQGGTIRPAEENYFSVTNRENWSRWAVLTGDVWKGLAMTTQADLQIVGKVSGMAYADRGRIIEVLVVTRRAAVHPHTRPVSLSPSPDAR